MKFSALCLGGFVAGALGACTSKCKGTCVAALGEVPEVGQAFCSSYLSLEAATETVTETATATSVHTNIETAFDTVTVTTLTTTIVGPTTTIFAKRAEPSTDASSKILSQCGDASSRISSACSCILSTTSTVTIVETVTATDVAEATATTTATVTVGAVATQSLQPTYTVPANPILNGNFEAYLTTGNILPWTDTTATTGGTVQIVNGVNPCTTTYCAGGSVVTRVYPPKTAGGYTSLKQDSFLAKPSTTYNFSFLYRCLNFDATSGIDVYYNGAKIGGITCTSTGSAFMQPTGIQFTTDATGRGSLEVRYKNPSALQYLYYYTDDFKATAV